MKRTILLYGLAVAAGTFLLEWLQYKHAVRQFSTEWYVVLVALVFAGLGAWVARRLGKRDDLKGMSVDVPSGPEVQLAKRPLPFSFQRDEAAVERLGVSVREYEVLELLAEGSTNQQIADALFVSTNTVKSHLSNLYQKLEVSRRTQAVRRARELGLIA